jgi:hypothetical protein
MQDFNLPATKSKEQFIFGNITLKLLELDIKTCICGAVMNGVKK